MMNGKKAKRIRREVRESAGPIDPENDRMMVRRYRATVGESVQLRDSHFWPEGSVRRVYQNLKQNG